MKRCARAWNRLAQANIVPDGVFLETNSIKVRLGNTDTQLKAKDVLQSALARTTSSRSTCCRVPPHWLTRINCFAHVPGPRSARRGALPSAGRHGRRADQGADRYAADIRTTLRAKEIRYSGIRGRQTVQIRFRDAEARDKAAAEIQRQNPDLLLKPDDSGSEFLVTASLKPEVRKRIQDFALQQNIRPCAIV